ncbi:MAG: STAS domain-containing protein [Turneriella sp.]|nr:STAS domain-containing protein [Turneriella sp.]
MAAKSGLKIKVKKKGDIHIVEVDGAIKSGMEFDLADELDACIHDAKVPKIIVDMKKVPFINSAALGILLNVYKEIERRNGRFGLCSISPDVDHLLEITKLSSVFDIYRNQEDALDSMED